MTVLGGATHPACSIGPTVLLGQFLLCAAYGTVPHAGFGLGFERTLAYLTGLANVRDAIPFPRTPGNARY